MIFDLLTPPLGPRGWGQKKFGVARHIHVSNSHTKFGYISSNGLAGDSIMEGRTDGGDNNILFAFLKKRGDNNGSKPCSGHVQINLAISRSLDRKPK